IASSSLRRTSAYTWRQDTLRMSATSASVRKRGGAIGPLRPTGVSLSAAPVTAGVVHTRTCGQPSPASVSVLHHLRAGGSVRRQRHGLPDRPPSEQKR